MGLKPVLEVADTLSLPIDAVTQVLAFLGRRGSGKTYGASKTAEAMLGAGAQVVILDPVGVWYGLRLAANGRDSGIAIPIFGGLHGDIPLEPTAGALIADVMVDRGISAVIDVSQMISSEQLRFATAFAKQLFQRKKAAPSALMLFLEECQEFIPQQPQQGEQHMLHEFQRLVKLGRNFGIGVSLISQRPQEVAKKVLNMTECVFAFQMTGPQERKAIREWVSEKGGDDDIVAQLPKFAVGQCHVWSPQWLQISETVKIGRKWTYDASSTPKVGARPIETRALAPVDLEALRTQMASTIEQAKENDPKELRARIVALQKQIRAVPERTIEKPIVDQAAVSRAVAQAVAAERKRAKFEAGRVRAELGRIAVTLKDVPGLLDAAIARLDIELIEANAVNPGAARAPVVRPQPTERPAPNPRREPRERTQGAIDTNPLPQGEKSVLIAVSQYPDGAARDQITILTGYKRSTRDAYIQRLQTKGLVDVGSGIITATDDGFNALGADYEPLPTGEALRDYWLDRLPEGEGRVLAALIDAYPNAAGRDEISEITGYKRSTRDAYIQRLGTRRLVIATGGGVQASAELFA